MSEILFTGLLAIAIWDRNLLRRYLVAWFQRSVGLLVVSQELEVSLDSPLRLYFNEFLSRSAWSGRTFTMRRCHVKPTKETKNVGFKISFSPRPTIYWNGWVPIVLRYELTHPNREDSEEFIYLSYIRGTMDGEKFMEQVIDYYNEHEKNFKETSFYVKHLVGDERNEEEWCYGGGNVSFHSRRGRMDDSISREELAQAAPIGYSKEDLAAEVEVRLDTSSMALTQEIRGHIKSAHTWMKSAGDYHSKGMKHKTAWGLYGKPGCGKSTLATLLAREMDIPLFVWKLGTFNDKTFLRYWKKYGESEKFCIFLFEDFDRVFNKDQDVRKQKMISFNTILNCLDGSDSIDGVFSILSFNITERIDSSLGFTGKQGTLSSRPGRIERFIEMAPPDEEGRRKIASKFFDDEKTIEELVAKCEGDTGDVFEKKCMNIHLKRKIKRENLQ